MTSLHIEGADAVTLLVAAATSFVNYHDISGDPAAALREGPGRRRAARTTPRSAAGTRTISAG